MLKPFLRKGRVSCVHTFSLAHCKYIDRPICLPDDKNVIVKKFLSASAPSVSNGFFMLLSKASRLYRAQLFTYPLMHQLTTFNKINIKSE